MAEYRQQFLRLRSRKDGAWLVPPELNTKLVADAREKGTSRTEIVTRILARAYNVPYEPSDRNPAGTRPSDDTDALNVRLPVELYQRVAFAAIGANRKTTDEILAALCAHYGLRMPPPPVRTRAPRTSRAAA